VVMGKSKRSNDVWIPFRAALALSTLADDTVLSAGILTLGEDLFVISIGASWTLRSGNDEGPIKVGWSHGDLTDTEIKEAIDASQTDPDDIIAVERGRRPVRKAGQIIRGDGAEEHFPSSGEMDWTKFLKSIGDGHTIDFWAFNESGGALTTGSVLMVDGVVHGRWQR